MSPAGLLTFGSRHPLDEDDTAHDEDLYILITGSHGGNRRVPA